MKSLFYLVVFVASHASSFGQRTEFSLQAGSGLFSYRGPNAVNETGMDYLYSSYLGNPYGRASGFSYSLAGQVQQITQKNYIYGIQAAYEQLTSRVMVTSIIGDFGSTPLLNGQLAELHNQYLNLNPFIGKRFGTTRFCLDATVGLDVGVGLVSKTRTEVVNPSWPWIVSGELRRPMPGVDIRPRANVTGYYRSFGLSIGYSRGLSNYTPTPYSTNASTYAQYWRASVICRLGKRA